MTAPKPSMITLKRPQWRYSTLIPASACWWRAGDSEKHFYHSVELCRAAWSPGRLAWYVAPTYKQAKRVAWKPLKQMTRPYWAMQLRTRQTCESN